MTRSLMFAKSILLFALLCIQSFSLAQGSAAVSESGPDLDVKELRIDDLEASLLTMNAGPERDYFTGVLANRANRVAESIRLLNSALPGIRASRPDRAAVALHALADDYSKNFQYAEAAKAYEDLLTHYANQLSPEELKSTKDDAGVTQILREAPAQTISWDGAVRLKTERNPLNSQNVDLTVNGVRGPWLVDTGASLSVVSKSFAVRLGLKPLPGVASAQAGLTGIDNPLRVALLPTLQIGGATMHNVVVMVFEDENLKVDFGKTAYQINGIIGYPVLQALGTVTFLHDGEFEAGNKTRSAGVGARMFMNRMAPVIECKIEGSNLPFGFDTGAAGTDLFVRYYDRFRGESKSWKKATIKTAGAGGVVKQAIYVQPKINLGIGDKMVTLDGVSIHASSTGTDLSELYGNLGQDVVANFSSFTLDFQNMTFNLGEPLTPAKAH